MLKIILIAVAIVVVLILSFLMYYGAFHKVTVVTATFDECWFVYKACKGPYAQTAKVSDSIYYVLLNNDRIETYKGMCIFYDNPKETEPEQCRSLIGCVLEAKDLSTISNLQEKYQVRKLEKGTAFSTTFPYKGKLSVILGVMKVYPTLFTFMKDKGRANEPIIELCDVPQKTFFYYTGFDPALPAFEEME